MAHENTPKCFRFFDLPAELRTQIYEELLVTDASLRLGHHGPFCLVPKKPTHPTILRTCRRALSEGAPVLYGANSFFLGTVGFKPIYSCSFIASIGAVNSSLIRKLIVHSNCAALLTRVNLKRWIDGLGIAFDTLKVLAISFEAPKLFDLYTRNNAHNSGTNNLNGGLPHLLNLNMPPVLPTQGLAQNTSTTAALANQSHPTNQPNITTATVTVTTTTTWQTVATGPGQVVPSAQTWTQISPASTNITATATLGSPNNPATVVASSSLDVMLLPSEFERWAKLDGGWLKHASTRTVSDVVNVANTDLRAGDAWLIYRDPNVRQLPSASPRIC